MSNIIIVDNSAQEIDKLALSDKFQTISEHNVYLSVKSYLASMRANTARAKGRSEVRGGGKKPWAQKGRGTARSGSSRSPIWVGGGKAFGPTARNYDQKVNRKQKALAFRSSVTLKASENKFFAIESINIESGKTKDASKFLSSFTGKDYLIIVKSIDENFKTYQAFRNLKNCYLVEESEVNTYMICAYDMIIAEKSTIPNILREDV